MLILPYISFCAFGSEQCARACKSAAAELSGSQQDAAQPQRLETQAIGVTPRTFLPPLMFL